MRYLGMVKKPPKRPSDPIALAKVIGDLATGQTEQIPADQPTDEEIRRVMSLLGKKGGLKGGKARAAKLSPTTRAEIARKAAKTRWKRKTSKE